MNNNKDFAMSVYFVPETEFYEDYICVKSKRMVWNLSTPDAYLGIELYNALCGQKYVWYKFSDNNEIRLINIRSEKEKIITGKKAIFNTLSPIVIRDHDQETGKDWFYTFEDEIAVSILKRNLKSELKGKFDRDISYDIEQLQIMPVKMKKVIIQNYEMKIASSLGTFMMEGEPYLLQYLYQRGLGGKRSLCFGHLELL
jgi:CRISPR-associated endoribonuclease Cas6